MMTERDLMTHLGRAAGAAVRQPLPLSLICLLIALAAVAEEPPAKGPEAAAASIAAGYDAALSRAAELAPGDVVRDVKTIAGQYDAEALKLAGDARALFAADIRRDAHIGAEGPQAPFVVFVSTSMPRGALDELTRLAAARGDIDIVYRGVRPGDTIAGFASHISGAGDEVAPASIDPTLFSRHGVDLVPAVLDVASGRMVFGVMNPDGLDPAREDRAVHGRLYEIAEPDLAEMMKARAAEIDWREKAKAAIRRFWSHAPMQPLERASEDAVRRVDARFRLPRDFTLSDGLVLYREGEQIDPTEDRPFTLTLIVFDGRDDAELEIVEREARIAPEPVLMVSELPRERGWDRLIALEQRLKRPVYLMPAEVKKRFRLQRSVSVVSGGRGEFIIREIAPQESSNLIRLGRRE